MSNSWSAWNIILIAGQIWIYYLQVVVQSEMTRFPIVYKFLDEYTNNFTAWLGLLLAVSTCLLMFSLMNRIPEVIALF
jgi:hypothetical protein